MESYAEVFLGQAGTDALYVLTSFIKVCKIKNISYGFSPLLNSLNTQDSHMIELINKASCDHHDRNNLTTDLVLELADLISRIRKHYKGSSFHLTSTKFQTIRELAIRQFIDAIL